MTNPQFPMTGLRVIDHSELDIPWSLVIGGALVIPISPRGVAEARDLAKVVGQVRLLAGTLTLEPDGEAAGCNPAEVGSIPTGVFHW
jgi:hypothetical protein